VLVLVSDVARRRPLLGHEVLSPDLGCSAMYVQGACAARVPVAQSGPDLVMTGHDVLAACPGLAGSFAHIAVVDPPLTTGRWAAIAAAAPQAWIHALWGRAEVEFSGRVRDEVLSLDTVMRRVWRALAAGSGRFDEALEQELLSGGALLASASAVGAALRVLREAGLLCVDAAGGYHLERPQSKVDVSRTHEHRLWHTRYLTPDFLRTCLTAPL
jgi:hypothetical protein